MNSPLQKVMDRSVSWLLVIGEEEAPLINLLLLFRYSFLFIKLVRGSIIIRTLDLKIKIELGELQMGRIGEKLDIDFVVSTGDNFYDNGLTGDDDSTFEDSFTNIYTANSLQKPWYSGKFPRLTLLFPSST